jgi:DNA-binding transcriptional MerR regulator
VDTDLELELELELTIDDLAAAAGTTTRSVRSFQTMGLLERPELRGRTGIYRARHLQSLGAILRLQTQGFSLQSIAVLFAAQRRGESLASVLGLDADRLAYAGAGAGAVTSEPDQDSAELYGFADLQPSAASRRGATWRRRRLLSVVPTTVWDQTEAS